MGGGVTQFVVQFKGGEDVLDLFVRGGGRHSDYSKRPWQEARGLRISPKSSKLHDKLKHY